MHSALSGICAAIIAVLVVLVLGEWSGLGTTWSVLLGLASGALVARQAFRHRSLERARARWYENSQRVSAHETVPEAPVPGAENSAVTDPASANGLAAMLRADRVNLMWISYALIAGWALYEVVVTSQLAQAPAIDVAAESPASTAAKPISQPEAVTMPVVTPKPVSGDPAISTSLTAGSDTPAGELMVEASAPAPIAAPRWRPGSSRVCSCSDPRCGCRRSIDRMRPDSTRREM